MVNTNLTPRESEFLRQIVDSMGRFHRIDWPSYLQSNGLQLRSVTDFDIADSLWRKGWLKDKPDMAENNLVHLSHVAWKRFAMDEWHEIDEADIEKQRGEESGSW